MCTISFTILLSRSQSRGFTHFSQFILLFALMSRNIIGQQQQQCLFDVCMVQKLCATACDTRSHDCARMRRISIAIFAQIFIFSISENPNRFNNFFRLFISCLSSFTQFVSLSDFFHVFFFFKSILNSIWRRIDANACVSSSTVVAVVVVVFATLSVCTNRCLQVNLLTHEMPNNIREWFLWCRLWCDVFV